MVPVFYGADGVHKVAPPHSYIDIRDFKSPKHLAEYLLYLDKNDEEYMSYFLWKRHFTVTRGDIGIRKVFCKLCNYLADSNDDKMNLHFRKWQRLK